MAAPGATDVTSRRGALWFAALAGPVAWSLHELASYALVKLACSSGLVIMLHLVTLAALGLALAGGYVAFKARTSNVAHHDTAEFLATAGLLSSAIFAFAILMEAAPDLVVNPCW